MVKSVTVIGDSVSRIPRLISRTALQTNKYLRNLEAVQAAKLASSSHVFGLFDHASSRTYSAFSVCLQDMSPSIDNT
jgi:hypothetical protein